MLTKCCFPGPRNLRWSGRATALRKGTKRRGAWVRQRTSFPTCETGRECLQWVVSCRSAHGRNGWKAGPQCERERLVLPSSSWFRLILRRSPASQGFPLRPYRLVRARNAFPRPGQDLRSLGRGRTGRGQLPAREVRRVRRSRRRRRRQGRRHRLRGGRRASIR